MRRVSLCTSAALAALLLAGCADSVQHGTILTKNYLPASQHTEYQPVYGQHCTSKPGYSSYCTTYVITYVPYQVADPECYQFFLKDDKGHTGDVCVSAFDYNRMNVGQKW